MMARVLVLGADVEEWDCIIIMGMSVIGTPLLRAIKKGKVDTVKFLLLKKRPAR